MKHLKPYTSFINEGRFYNDQLNQIFWKDNIFNAEIRTKLLQIAHDFYADLKIDAPIEDIQLTGSLANYNWTKHSDLDIHVIMDLSIVNPDLELVKTAMEGLKTTWNQRHPVNIHGFDVELYAQDINQLHLASGLYSLMKNEWLREPEFNPPTIDPKDVDLKADAYIFAIKQMISDLKDSTPDEANDIMERASVLKKKISKSRDENLTHKGGEFSIENLVFKRLRNEGWIGKLIDIKAHAYSRIYSEPTGAIDSKFATEADVLDESLVGKGSMIAVLGPKIDGAKQLFLFNTDWSKQVERNGWTVNMVGLSSPMRVVEQDGKLVAKTVSLSPSGLKKYAGLSDYHVVLNAKTKTPFWHQTVKHTSASSLLKDMSASLQSIPEVTFN